MAREPRLRNARSENKEEQYMKCHWCGAEIRLLEGAPGSFFRLGVASALVAALALAVGLLHGGSGDLYVGTLVVFCIAAASAVMSAVGVWTALIDGRSMASSSLAEPGRRCESCGGITPLKPWSR
jgi:hypothetical protein